MVIQRVHPCLGNKELLERLVDESDVISSNVDGDGIEDGFVCGADGQGFKRGSGGTECEEGLGESFREGLKLSEEVSINGDLSLG